MPEKEQELLPVRIWESVKTFGLRAFFLRFSQIMNARSVQIKGGSE